MRVCQRVGKHRIPLWTCWLLASTVLLVTMSRASAVRSPSHGAAWMRGSSTELLPQRDLQNNDKNNDKNNNNDNDKDNDNDEKAGNNNNKEQDNNNDDKEQDNNNDEKEQDNDNNKNNEEEQNDNVDKEKENKETEQKQDDSKVPTRAPTKAPTENPTPRTTPGEPVGISRPLLVPTLTPTNAETSAAQEQEQQPLQLDKDTLKQLESIQIAAAEGPMTTITLDFSLWLPSRKGVTGAEEASFTTHTLSSITAALRYLFCLPQGDLPLEDWGLTNWNQNHVCALREMVQDGDGVLNGTPLRLSGGRSLKTEEDLEAKFEKNKYSDSEIEEEMKEFEEWKATKQGGKGADKEEKGGKEDQVTSMLVSSDPSIALLPPQLSSRVHFHADHKNIAWTTWKVSWPVVRLSMKYLETSWLSLAETGASGATEDEIFAHASKMLQDELESYMNDNINLKVLDVVLADLLGEAVMTSSVGFELDTFVENPSVSSNDLHNGMTPVSGMTSLDPDPIHTLRLVGITMLVCTLKVICILAYLSQKRKKAREDEWKRVNMSKGVLHSPEGLDEMLQKNGNPAILDLQQKEMEDDEVRIPLPAGLQLQERCTL